MDLCFVNACSGKTAGQGGLNIDLFREEFSKRFPFISIPTSREELEHLCGEKEVKEYIKKYWFATIHTKAYACAKKRDVVIADAVNFYMTMLGHARADVERTEQFAVVRPLLREIFLDTYETLKHKTKNLSEQILYEVLEIVLNMQPQILKQIEYKTRAIIIVPIRMGGIEYHKPFYKSTGRNSGHPDTWFPFEGIASDGWFIKGEGSHKDVFSGPNVLQEYNATEAITCHDRKFQSYKCELYNVVFGPKSNIQKYPACKEYTSRVIGAEDCGYKYHQSYNKCYIDFEKDIHISLRELIFCRFGNSRLWMSVSHSMGGGLWDTHLGQVLSAITLPNYVKDFDVGTPITTMIDCNIVDNYIRHMRDPYGRPSRL